MSKQPKILILGQIAYTQLFSSIGFKTISQYTWKDVIDIPKDIDAVLFSGGEDINPSLYGENKSKYVYSVDYGRDATEEAIFHEAIKRNIPMFGICRGAQFLNVMNGGKLVQHMHGHTGTRHEVVTINDEMFNVTSSHHQMMLMPESHLDYVELAWTKDRRSNFYYNGNDEVIEGIEKEMEAVLFPKTKCLGVQWHPEWMHKDEDGRIIFQQWCEELIYN